MVEHCHMCLENKFDTCDLCKKSYCKGHEAEPGLCQHCEDYPEYPPSLNTND